ncbi:MAG TPA: hypothetical protein DDY70_02075 [Clostridiales bacterium]|nr:hypothetical protein [Clostridiales bacterium]
MTKRKFRVQWVAILCLVALLVGALSVVLFRNTVTAAGLSGEGIREDFSSFNEGALYARVPADYADCIDESNWGEYSLIENFTAPDKSQKWQVLLFNGNKDTSPKRYGFNTAKSVGVEAVEGNVGGKALKLVASYSPKSSLSKFPTMQDNSARVNLLVQQNVTEGMTVCLHFRFMVPNEVSTIDFYPKAGNGWPGNFLTVRNTVMTFGSQTMTLVPGHWYDVVWSAKCGAKEATVQVDGVSSVISGTVSYTSLEYPVFQAYPSLTEGKDSILYVDDVACFEKAGDYSILTDRMEVVSSAHPMTESKMTVVGGATVDELRESITMGYDVTMKIMNGETEITDGAADIADGYKLVFTTADGGYIVTVPIAVLPDRPTENDLSETFNNLSFVIGKNSAVDGNFYKGSATGLLEGVSASSVFADADSLSVARAPFKKVGDMALLFHSGKTSASADMTILRSSSLPYSAGYGHILEFDVIATGKGGTLTVGRTAVSDKVTIDIDSVSFAGSTLTIATKQYHHIVWEITAEGTQNVYADGVLVGTKTGSALTGAGGISFGMTKASAVDADFAVDNLTSYNKALAYTPVTDTSYPRSDVMNVTEESRTFYIQGANFDVNFLLGTFTEDDVALFDADGNQLTKGNFDRKTGYLVYYPKNNGTPKTYTLGNPSFSFSSIYADGMVLQRNKEINLTGFANASGIDATATLTDENGVIVAISTAKTTAGQFSIKLPAQSAAKGLSLTIRVASGAEVFYEKTFRDVAIGEVWILSGQSNMWLPVHQMEDAAEYLANADNYGDNIRYFTQSRTASFTPETDTQGGGWYVATSENLSSHEISGIGYVMATRLAEQLGDVPVAVINAYYAGSSIVAWFDLDTIQSTYPALYDTYLDYKSKGTPSSWNNVPSVCYNRMVHPIKGYTANGVIWYQGESNCGTPALYMDYYKTLTSLWREWLNNEELPFMVMQLAPYGASSYPAFRNAQYNMVQNDPYSYLISTTEDGPLFSAADNLNGFNYAHVHPARKSSIGLRTADMILGEIYGVDLGRAYKAPEIVSAKRDGNRVILTFDSELSLLHGGVVEGFTLDGVVAVGIIDGNVLTLEAAGVTAPTTVAYAQDSITVVMKDGTVYRNIKNIHVGNDAQSDRTYADRSYTTFETAEGEKITVRAGSHDIIRSTYGGNLTNESGYAMPAFSLTVSAD